MTQVLVVEDEAAIAELVAIHLRHSGFEVTIASTAHEALEAVDAHLPDLVVLDWMLPGQSGPALSRQWRASPRTAELPIILLTARSEEADKVAGLDAGADDYLTKPFSPKELLARVRAVLRRRAPHALDAVIEIGPLRLDPGNHRVTHGADAVAQELKLGPTEFRLLHFLMTHADRVHTRARLIDQVWGDHVYISERTVDVHIKRLREALAPSGAAALIETVRGVGYRLAPPMSEPG